MADFLIKKEKTADRFAMFRPGTGLILRVSLGLFILSLVSYAVLIFIDRSQVKTEENLLQEVRVRQDELRPELVNQIFTLESKLASIQTLINKHPFSSNILKFLEENTLPNIRFLTFDFKSDTGRLEMSGDAASYAALTEQIILFERNSRVEKVEFGGLTLGAGNLVNFRLTMVFKPVLVRTPPFIEEEISE